MGDYTRRLIMHRAYRIIAINPHHDYKYNRDNFQLRNLSVEQLQLPQ